MTENCLPMPLQVATHYSFLRGASYPSELFTTAAAMGYKAMGIADHQTVAGLVQAHCAAREAGIRLIPGCCLQLTDGTILLVYPKDRTVWARLCFWLTLGYKRGTRETFALDWHDLAHPAAPPPRRHIMRHLPQHILSRQAQRGHTGKMTTLPMQHNTRRIQTRLIQMTVESSALSWFRRRGPIARHATGGEDAAICVSQLHQMKAALG
ncbi:MAG: PHP domain-containing protein [Acetobacteraceae bacterium]